MVEFGLDESVIKGGDGTLRKEPLVQQEAPWEREIRYLRLKGAKILEVELTLYERSAEESDEIRGEPEKE